MKYLHKFLKIAFRCQGVMRNAANFKIGGGLSFIGCERFSFKNHPIRKKLTLIFLMFFNGYWLFGQVCGTPHSVNPVIYPDDTDNPDIQSDIAGRGSVGSSFCVDVFFHIVRHTNGTDAFTRPNTIEIVKKLNEVFTPHNIHIHNAGIAFINNSNYLDIDYNANESRSIASLNDRPGVINYYVVKTIQHTIQGRIRYYAGIALGTPSDALFTQYNRVLWSTSAHELGHCLGLHHTHRGLGHGESGCPEAIDGSNCKSCGDLVCDTPADPGDNKEVNADEYTPDLTNIMSYYSPRDHFTDGQGQRMRAAMAHASVLSDVTSNGCAIISKVDNVCYPQTKTIFLSNLIGGATTTWTSSSNVQIVSSNVSSATIRAINGTSLGRGWIQARHNGISLIETFDVGPPTDSYLSSTSIHVGEAFTLGTFQMGIWNLVHIVCKGCERLGQDIGWNITATGSAVRHVQGANNALIKPMAEQIRVNYNAFNECGCSGTLFQYFNVISDFSDGHSRRPFLPSNPNPTLVPMGSGGVLNPEDGSEEQFIPIGDGKLK